MSLLHILQEQLAVQKSMPFAEFMHHALYTPNLGYYSSSLPKIGSAGDFITAPELTPLFGYTVANQCQQVLSAVDSPNILEFGAGTGSLCIAILTRLEQLNCLPQTYWILEPSAHLRQKQQQQIAQQIPHLASVVHWLDAWPETSFNGVILANEVLDAMPIHRFMRHEDQLFESFISLDAQQQLHEEFKPCTNARLLAYLEHHLPLLPQPYCSEVNLFIDDWIAQNSAILNQGMVLLIDYGFPRHEYYHPERQQGTIMCHYQHQSHTNPLINVGEQDITAHVDFTHVAEAAQQAGFHVAGYTNQASFLLANGLLHLVDSIEQERESFHATQAIKQLIQPSEMGELFKVIALTKQLELPLNGFLLNDKRVSL